jgi:nucleotide-binding universal stress UspA family protein
MERPNRHGVLVGVDGAADGLLATVWAAREAARRGVPLTVAHVRMPWPPIAYPDFEQQIVAEVEAEASTAVDAAEAAAHEVAPDLPVHKIAVDGPAAQALVDLAGDADLVVVGSRGRGAVARLVLGSVADKVARHAPGTVVVVRAEDPSSPVLHDRSEDLSAPVVVGVDLAADFDATLAFAAEQAAARGTSLLAVHVVPAPPGYIPTFGSPPDFWPDEAQKQAAEALERAVEPLVQTYPQLTVKTLVLQGSAAEGLIGSSEAAALVVVGATGSGAFEGLRLGSVGSHLLHHARCAVAIVRP